MKLGLFALFTCMNGLVLAASLYERQLQYEGAPATITLTVRDEHGAPVEDALGEAFYSRWSAKSEEISVRSDEHGNLAFQGGGVYEAIFRVTKEGYYETKGRVLFQLPAEDPEDFWQRKEWEPTHLDVTLKTIRNPIPAWLYTGKVIALPRYDIPLGLDLQLLDWVPPYGEGRQTDVILSFHLVDKQNRQEKWQEIKGVTFTFPNPGDGLQICRVTTPSSGLITDYTVDSNKPFIKTYTCMLEAHKNKYQFLPEATYFAFRVRCVKNPAGEIIRANYGVISHRLAIDTSEIFFRGGFNPTPNDTNIEFDPKQNLMPKRYKVDLIKAKALKEKTSKEKKGYENTSF